MIDPSTVAFAPADPAVPPASELLSEMVAELRHLYQVGGGHIGVPLEIHELAPPGGIYLVGRMEGTTPDGVAVAVAGGGVRTIGAGVGEVKRMYVRAGWRGHGLGRLLLAALEGAAADLGLHRLRLDTGPLQGRAQRIYEQSGYRTIGNYNGNQHASYWGEKILDGRAATR